MNLSLANCTKCNKTTAIVWAANPPEEGNIYCPACFVGIRKKQGGINFPFSLYLGKPVIVEGTWQDQLGINFASIAQFIETCLGMKQVFPKEYLTSDQDTLEELLIRLHDFVTDSTVIPYWRFKIAFADKTLAAGRKSGGSVSGSADLRGKIIFWQTRIEQALIPDAARIAIKQLAMVQHLKNCLIAFRNNQALPKLPAAVVEVNWELLEPDGNSMWQRILNYHQSLGDLYGKQFEEARLKILSDQNPDVIYVGRSKFEGYVVFVFSLADVAFLESGYLGNALYIMKATEWRELSKLSKTDLIVNPRHGVTRVIHSYAWSRRIRELLRRYGVV